MKNMWYDKTLMWYDKRIYSYNQCLLDRNTASREKTLQCVDFRWVKSNPSANKKLGINKDPRTLLLNCKKISYHQYTLLLFSQLKQSYRQFYNILLTQSLQLWNKILQLFLRRIVAVWVLVCDVRALTWLLLWPCNILAHTPNCMGLW